MASITVIQQLIKQLKKKSASTDLWAGGFWAFGFNRAGYVNAKVDDIINRLSKAVDVREQIPLHRELLQEQMTDIAFMPLYWEVLPILMVKGVSGPKHVRNTAAQNMYYWNRE